MNSKHYFYTAEEVAEVLGVSKPTAYVIIRSLNEELVNQGYRVVSGKISTEYFNKKYYLTITNCLSNNMEVFQIV